MQAPSHATDDVRASVHDAARRARVAARTLGSLTTEVKDRALHAAADAVLTHTHQILAANVADLEAARAAGQDAGVRFQLPPRPPHHAGSSGSLGGANGNGHPQQADQEQQVQQAEQQQQQGTTADDIVARLAVLRTR